MASATAHAAAGLLRQLDRLALLRQRRATSDLLVELPRVRQAIRPRSGSVRAVGKLTRRAGCEKPDIDRLRLVDARSRRALLIVLVEIVEKALNTRL